MKKDPSQFNEFFRKAYIQRQRFSKINKRNQIQLVIIISLYIGIQAKQRVLYKKFRYIIQRFINLMHQLNSQDVFFLKMKFQRSINLPKSPINEKKILFPQTNFEKSQDNHVKRNNNGTDKKISTDQNLNNWLFKKQLKLKAFFYRKNKQQKGDQFLIKISDDIKFRDQQDWLELKKSTQSKKSPDYQYKINLQNNDPSKSKKKMKKLSLRIENPSSKKQFQILLKSDSNNFNSFRDTKLNQKIDYLCQKKMQVPSKIKTENDGLQFLRLSPRYPKKVHKNVENQRDSKPNYCPNQNKTQIKLLRTTDSSQKKVLTQWTNHSLLQGSQPIKRYTNRLISPSEKQELKSEYHQLDKRLNSLIMSVKQEKTLQV